MKIKKFHPFESNTLKGFLDAETPEGYIFKGCTWHQKTDGEKTSEWIGLPAREYEKDGERAWANIIEFSTKNLYWDFVNAVLEALKDHLDQEKLERAWEPQEQGAEEAIPF
jgi:hypothetical protein